MTTHEEFESLAALDAIGAATPAEAQQLREHADGCADCARAQAELGDAATLLARGLDPVPPPPDVRARVLAAIGSRDDVVNDDEDADIGGRGSSRWWLSAAAVLFLALWGWRELHVRAQRERIVASEAEAKSLTDENARLTEKNEQLSAQLAALASPETRTIALTGQQLAPAASARVFLEPSHRRALVFFANMPANATDKSYQLWILRADQPKPQSAGTFDVTQNGKASLTIENLPVATEIKGLAVTIEPRGGVEQPTNTDFVVAGNT
jgi:cell division protein FtsB